ncbi:MAG: hypothetical protein JXR37_17065 [Kiritimatiellae bacterium]|nr:hypothetical protein [Kiritimatiellia bacterium]
MKLEMGNGLVIENPEPDEIEHALTGLDGGEESYAILAQSEMTYIQTCGGPETGFMLEYQDGTLDAHFGATNLTISLEQVTAAFLSYAAGTPDWKTAFGWHREQVDEE